MKQIDDVKLRLDKVNQFDRLGFDVGHNTAGGNTIYMDAISLGYHLELTTQICRELNQAINPVLKKYANIELENAKTLLNQVKL